MGPVAVKSLPLTMIGVAEPRAESALRDIEVNDGLL